MGEDSFTAGQFSLWVPLNRALEMAAAKMGNAAYWEIVVRLRNGLLVARAQNTFVETGGKKKAAVDFARVPTPVWDAVAEFENLSLAHLWSTNTVRVELGQSSLRRDGSAFEHFGVRVAPEGLVNMGVLDPIAMRPELSVPPQAAPAEKHAGGAPAKAFWDRLWADIGARLYVGDLKPAKQADIERAMLDWASANNESLSEQAARTRARLIWQAIKEKDKN